jgi:hypothetical protein
VGIAQDDFQGRLDLQVVLAQKVVYEQDCGRFRRLIGGEGSRMGNVEGKRCAQLDQIIQQGTEEI